MIPTPLWTGEAFWPASPTAAPWTPPSAPHSGTTSRPWTAQVDDLFLQPDGKIVVSGKFSQIIDGSGNPPRRGIARFSANGLLDNTFTPSLTLPSGANTLVISAMARQPNGKILIEENFFNVIGL